MTEYLPAPDTAITQRPPTWESLLSSQTFCTLNPSIYRLKWPLFSPLSALQVLSNPTDPASPTTTFATTDSDGTSSYHSISDEALTEPRLSSLTVTAEPISDYTEEFKPEEEAPTLRISPSTRPYITIGDYVLAVHPWLNGFEVEILTALEELYGPRPDGVERVPGNGVRLWVWMGVDPSWAVVQEEEVPDEWPRKWEARCEVVKGLIEGYERRAGMSQGGGSGGGS